MPVEIQVLSGARQGVRVAVDASEFRVGDCPGAEIALDPSQDPAAQGRAVRFSLRSDGWYIQNHGVGSVLLNEQRLSGARRIRSGDVVRMSERGPDLVFHLLSGAAPEPAGRENHATAAHPTALPVDGADSVGRRNRATNGPWIAVAVAGVLLCLVLGVLFTRQPSASQTPVAPQAASPTPPTAQVASDSEKPAPPPAPLPEAKAAEVAAAPAPSKPPAEPVAEIPAPQPAQEASPQEAAKAHWDRLGQAAQKGVLLLAVQETKSGSTWVFASSVAIAENEVLTTATVASELAKFQADAEHWQVWACRDLATEHYPLQDIRVHAGYVRAGDNPQQRIYFDMARITVEGKLPEHLPVATPPTLAALGGGTPLACIGVPHDPDPVDRFQNLAPQVVLGKVFLLTTLPPAGGPRLIHFKASLPPHCYGAPLLDAEGSVVALYAESAPAGAVAGQEVPLHYAVVLEPQLLALGQQGRGSEVWIAPPRSTPPPPPPAQP